MALFDDTSMSMTEAPAAVNEKVEEVKETPEVVENAENVENTDKVEEKESEVKDTENESAEDGDEVVYEIDGQEVTKEQLDNWKEAFNQKQEATKNTVDLDEQRKDIAAKAQKLDQSLAAITEAKSELEKLVLSDLEEVDMEALRKEDYTEYLQLKETIDERKQAFNGLLEKAQKANSEKLAEESKKLNDLRGWADKSKYDSDVKAFEEFSKEHGFTESDIKSLTSSKVFSALIEAAAIKKGVAEKAKTRTKVVPKTVKSKKTSGVSQRPKTRDELANALFKD